jgi:hypothetical protein
LLLILGMILTIRELNKSQKKWIDYFNYRRLIWSSICLLIVKSEKHNRKRNVFMISRFFIALAKSMDL